MALELVVAELRKDKEELRDTVDRMIRAQTGAPPRKADVARPTRESIPDDIEDEIRGYSSPIVRRQLRHEVREAHSEGTTWPAILDKLRGPAPAVWGPDDGETVGEMLDNGDPR
jgi:hypothetical protein